VTLATLFFISLHENETQLDKKLIRECGIVYLLFRGFMVSWFHGKISAELINSVEIQIFEILAKSYGN